MQRSLKFNRVPWRKNKNEGKPPLQSAYYVMIPELQISNRPITPLCLHQNHVSLQNRYLYYNIVITFSSLNTCSLYKDATFKRPLLT